MAQVPIAILASQYDMGLPKLRDYQVKIIKDTYQYLKKGIKRVLIAAPTGSGKTKTSAAMVYDAAKSGKQVAFVVHRDSLIEQTVEELSRNWHLNCGVVAGGYKENRSAKVQVCSFQSLGLGTRDMTWLEPALVLSDECHITSYSEVMLNWFPRLNQCVEGVTEPYYIGLTGTPWRSSKKESLGEIFEALVCAPMPAELIARGYLVPLTYYRVPNAKGQDMLADIGYIIAQWRKVGQNDQTIAFCPTVAFAKQLAIAFQDIGVLAETVTEGTSRTRRRNIFNGFKEHDIKVISSVNALAEGYDATNARVAILAQNLTSKARIIQEIGRVVRSHTYSDGSNKRDCIVLDAMGLIERLGFLFEDMQITERDLRLPDYISKGGEMPFKVCTNCQALNYIQARVCKQCNHPFDIGSKLRDAPKGDMIRLPMPDSDAERFAYYSRNLKLAFQKQLSPEWADNRFRRRYGTYPPLSWRSNAILGRDATQEQQEEYKRYLKNIAFLNKKPDGWVAKQLCLELGI